MGRNAFGHKGGMHVAAMNIEPRSYEHVDPARVGNERRVLVSELSGRGTITSKAQELGIPVDDPERVSAILARLKDLEHAGFHFEVADGSFELLLERETGVYRPLFELETFRVITEKRADGRVETEATVKVHHEGERLMATAEGVGPIDALDAALRAALQPRVPELSEIGLVNFKVRILDESKGAGAVVRVLLESGDGHESWGTIGVSGNVIEASWEALVDSLEHGVRRIARTRAASA